MIRFLLPMLAAAVPAQTIPANLAQVGRQHTARPCQDWAVHARFRCANEDMLDEETVAAGSVLWLVGHQTSVCPAPRNVTPALWFLLGLTDGGIYVQRITIPLVDDLVLVPAPALLTATHLRVENGVDHWAVPLQLPPSFTGRLAVQGVGGGGWRLWTGSSWMVEVE